MVLMNKKIFFQLFRFGVIGLLAAVVHFSVVVLLVQMTKMQPLLANIFAFLIAFQVSYIGHRYWTFRDTVTKHRTAFSKLFLVNGLGFLANEGLFYIFLMLGIPYQIALIFVLLIIPIVTFVVNKFWVFG